MELLLQKFRISLVLTSFYFPLTSPDILDSLKKRDFNVGGSSTPLPTGPRTYVSGYIARKHDVIIDIDDRRHLVGAQGESVERTLQIFSEIADIIEDDFYININAETDYFEVISQFLIKSDKDPYHSIQNMVQLKNQEKLNSILPSPANVYRFSLSPKNIVPLSRDWFEISISPKLTMPTKAYWAEIIFRNKKMNTVLDFANQLEERLLKFIEIIELDS